VGSVTVDIYLIFAAYFMSVIALGASVYAVWTLLEIRELYRQKKSKSGNAWDHYHNPKNQKKSQAKGHFDNIYK
jgi:hypothetical protein